jgi:hypothetical protein
MNVRKSHEMVTFNSLVTCLLCKVNEERFTLGGYPPHKDDIARAWATFLTVHTSCIVFQVIYLTSVKFLQILLLV